MVDDWDNFSKEQAIIPLNIKIPFKNYNLTDEISIIQLNDLDKEKFFKIDKFIRTSEARVKYENTLKINFAFSGNNQIINWNQQQLILALKLINNKNYFIPFTHISEHMTGICMFHNNWGLGNEIELDEKQLEEFKLIYNKIIEVKEDIHYKYFLERLIAIIRGMNSTPKLRFVDLISLLEGIILQNDKENLSYTFSFYLYYIFIKKITKKDLYLDFNEIKEIYNLRSKIAHSSFSQKDEVKYSKYINSQYLQKLETIVFEVFKIYLFEKDFFNQKNIQRCILIDLTKGINKQNNQNN